MLIDAHTLNNGATIETDICIIGAGAAGISLAMEFINSGSRVCILESGGTEYNDDTQALFDGKNTGFPYYDIRALRLRYFGGTTNHWSGACRPLDTLDFEQRDWVPHSGWPLTKKQLDPYYEKAHVLCELGPYNYDPAFWEGNKNPRLPIKDDRVSTAMFQVSSPTRFGSVYRDEIEQAENITTYLNANVVDLQLDPLGNRINNVVATTLNQAVTFTVNAQQIILATGAIENTRILLACNKQEKNGLGNQHDLVGRYFMEHLSLPGAIYQPTNEETPMGLYERQTRNAVPAKGYLTLSPSAQQHNKLLNIRAFILKTTEAEGMHATVDGLHAFDVIDEIINGKAPKSELPKHLLRASAEIDKLLIYSYRKYFRRPSKYSSYYLYYHMEQAPNPDSRVTLSNEVDALGMPKVNLDWRFTNLEQHTANTTGHVIAEALGLSGLGRVKPVITDPNTGWPTDYRGVRGAWHQMGTTRMHNDSKQGVVDSNCRVHGLSNLYIAGSSVFPTSGYTNPTLTIVALALRLADHIKQQTKGQQS